MIPSQERGGLFSRGGVIKLSTTTGQRTEQGFQLYNSDSSSGDNGQTFGKGTGLGDLELACIRPPLEIGNHVWCDSIQNGIQDACERGISDLIVQLYDSNGVLVGQDTTVNGQYYFNEYNVDTTGITVNGNGLASPSAQWSGLNYDSEYFIVFGDGQFSAGHFGINGESLGITILNDVGTNDNIDSDVDGAILTTGSLGSRPDGLPFIELTTSRTGCGDHKYDMGVTCTTLYSLGNQVFYDNDNSGDLNGTENGIDGVQLRLLNGDGSVYDSDPITPGTQSLIVTTANGGYYRFDGLTAGDYIVEVIATNFISGGSLANFTTSTGSNQEANPNDDVDINDNGLDLIVNGGIRSGLVTLASTEPLVEIEPPTYDPISIIGSAAPDVSSNLTVDFGFFPSCPDPNCHDIIINRN